MIRTQIPQIHDQMLRVSVALVLGVFHVFFLSNLACAQSGPSVPADDGFGNYTLSTAHLGCSTSCMLEEKLSGTSYWQTVVSGGGDYVATNMVAGLHSYRFIDLEWDPEEYEWSQWTSTTTTVLVGMPPTVDSLDTQYNYTYEARFDGVDEIFLRRTSETDPGDGAIDVILLAPSNSGTFIPSVPTVTQAAQASSWPIANINLRIGDVNVDGFVDLALLGLDGLMPGASDQIVFAPGQLYVLAPMGVRKLDQHLVDFATDMVKYIGDPNYFDNASVEVESYEWVIEWDCSWFWWGQSFEYECTQSLEQVEIVTEVFPGINASAVLVWEKLKAIAAGTGTMDDVKSVMGDVFGVTIGGGTFCVDFGIEDDDPSCPGIEFEYAIATLANDAEVEGTASTREADVVYLTRRRVLDVLSYHLALEYRGPTSLIAETLSAAPGSLVFPLLVSTPNRWQEQANLTIGTVTSSFLAESNFAYFTRLRAADAIYNDCIPYVPLPATNSTPEIGYNSNGYISGILSATGGIPTEPISDYYGGSAAVPADYFTVPNMPCP